MIIISHSRSIKKPFKVATTGKNGEPLKSAQLLTTKKNCFKNILADLTENYEGCLGIWIKDETTDEVFYHSIEVLRKKAGLKAIQRRGKSDVYNSPVDTK